MTYGRGRPSRAAAVVSFGALTLSAVAQATAAESAGLTRGGVQSNSTEARALGRWVPPFWDGGDQPFDPPSAEKSKKFPAAVSAVVLPDGRLLYWNGTEGWEDSKVASLDENLRFVGQNSRARVLDTRSSEPTWTIPREERGTTGEAHDHYGPYGTSTSTKDLFCSDHKLLYDGTVLIAGGTEWHHYDDVYGDDETRIFDPTTVSFSSAGAMREPRWYPSLVTLADGRVLVASGLRRFAFSPLYAEPSFSQVRLNELYDPATRSWDDAGTSEWTLPLYPRLHLLPDGKVFYGAAGEYWSPFGETADEATWILRRTYDPATKRWTLLDRNSYGGRSGAASALLRLEPPYEEAAVLVAGGTAGPGQGTAVATTISEVVRWSADDGIEQTKAPTSPLAGLAGDGTQLRNRRWHGTPAVLPTGEVLLFNGGDTDDAIDPGSAAAVRTPELYDPVTGTWSELAPSARDRIYHSSAVLLPDGRVLVGGHAPLPTHYTNNNNPVARSNTHRDSTFEVYEPPYLFRGPRPEISHVTPVAGGRKIKLGVGGTTAARDISEVVLVRLSANTHAFDSDIRAVKLRHQVSGTTVVAELPNGGDGRIVPPGPYYVFAIRDNPDGPVPSVAHVVLIKPTGDGAVAADGI